MATERSESIAALVLGTAFLGTLMFLDSKKTRDNFEQDQINRHMQYPTNKQMYNNTPYTNTKKYVYDGANLEKVNLTASGDQLLEYQLYQQAVNAATPTTAQLDSISGNSFQQTGVTAEQLKGGLTSEYAPYNVLTSNGAPIYNSEYQAVNIPNKRAESISACAQNAPSMISTSLLPKPVIPGESSWDVGAPQDALANQNFLAATQQIGVDTVLSSLKNPSYDIRNNIPNPISVVSPWMNSSITPDLERRPLDTFIADQGVYGPGPAGLGQNGYYVGK